MNADMKSKLDELSGLYDAAQRDNRAKQTQIQQLTHELDKTREQKDFLARENKKITGTIELLMRTRVKCAYSTFCALCLLH